jgi:hypothetical protein
MDGVTESPLTVDQLRELRNSTRASVVVTARPSSVFRGVHEAPGSLLVEPCLLTEGPVLDGFLKHYVGSGLNPALLAICKREGGYLPLLLRLCAELPDASPRSRFELFDAVCHRYLKGSELGARPLWELCLQTYWLTGGRGVDCTGREELCARYEQAGCSS